MTRLSKSAGMLRVEKATLWRLPLYWLRSRLQTVEWRVYRI
jgi:hypothetical protein